MTLLHRLDRLLLRAASLVVPSSLRRGWLLEWQAELWHVRQATLPPHPHWSDERNILHFCVGSFADALCLRDQERTTAQPPVASSAGRILLYLASITFASGILAGFLPGVRSALQPPPYRDPASLMLLQSHDILHSGRASISPAEYIDWMPERLSSFAGIAFYQLSRQTLEGPRSPVQLHLAHASANLFDTLGLSFTPLPRTNNIHLPQLFVAEHIWRSYLRDNTSPEERILTIGGSRVQLAGIVANGAWMLPGNVDAWLLESASTLSALPPRPGFALARLTPTALASLPGSGYIRIPQRNAPLDHLSCTPATVHFPNPIGLFLFMIFLAALALPAIISVTMGEFQLSPSSLVFSKRLRHTGFLLAKITLILPLVWLASLDFAYASPSIGLPMAQGIQGIFSFVFGLAALYWAVYDQRQRCPICLRRLTHPARVGQPSRNFLAWNGTELICEGGHGLLHIPELPNSWFGSQRWLTLDPSWSALFS